MNDQDTTRGIAVVIPCFRASGRIEGVVRSARDVAEWVIVVDDACPEQSGDQVAEAFASDPQVVVLHRETNGGVGAAVVDGYREALARGASILVKVDADGQMDPALVPRLIAPIRAGEADYVKGNRFFSTDSIAEMPTLRVIGNAGLSFLSKLSTGYWDLFDPANGLTAIHAEIARRLPLDRLAPRYFFESDLLFRLGVLRARVVELLMEARYGDEESQLSEFHASLTFPLLHFRNFTKRVAYNYFLRNFSLASLNLVVGLAMVLFGVGFGALRWRDVIETGAASTAGTVMLAALPLILGIQLLLSFLAYDISMTPVRALHPQFSGADPRHG